MASPSPSGREPRSRSAGVCDSGTPGFFSVQGWVVVFVFEVHSPARPPPHSRSRSAWARVEGVLRPGRRLDSELGLRLMHYIAVWAFSVQRLFKLLAVQSCCLLLLLVPVRSCVAVGHPSQTGLMGFYMSTSLSKSTLSIAHSHVSLSLHACLVLLFFRGSAWGPERLRV